MVWRYINLYIDSADQSNRSACLPTYTECSRREVQYLGSNSIAHSKQTFYVYICPVPNGFRDTDIPLYSSKAVDKKDIMYCCW
jgi:hypothetical protein